MAAATLLGRPQSFQAQGVHVAIYSMYLGPKFLWTLSIYYLPTWTMDPLGRLTVSASGSRRRVFTPGPAH